MSLLIRKTSKDSKKQSSDLAEVDETALKGLQDLVSAKKSLEDECRKRAKHIADLCSMVQALHSALTKISSQAGIEGIPNLKDYPPIYSLRSGGTDKACDSLRSNLSGVRSLLVDVSTHVRKHKKRSVQSQNIIASAKMTFSSENDEEIKPPMTEEEQKALLLDLESDDDMKA